MKYVTGTAIVTGGTSGLGRSIVKLMLEKGWKVATFGRRYDRIEELSRSTRNDRLLAETCDMRIEKQLDGFFKKVSAQFGKADVLILNAGEVGPADLPSILNLDGLDLRMVFETNVFSSYSVLKRALAMRNKNFLAVHITSDVVRNAYVGWGGYGASKAAMDFIIRTLNAEGNNTGIRGISIDPGDMDTEMHRLVLPDDTGLRSPDDSALNVLAAVEHLIEG